MISPCQNCLLPIRLTILAVLVSFLSLLQETMLHHPLLYKKTLSIVLFALVIIYIYPERLNSYTLCSHT